MRERIVTVEDIENVLSKMGIPKMFYNISFDGKIVIVEVPNIKVQKIKQAFRIGMPLAVDYIVKGI